MDITSVSNPPNFFPGVKTYIKPGSGSMSLSSNRVVSGSPTGTFVGRLMGSTSGMVLSIVSGAFTITQDGDVSLDGETTEAGSNMTVRIKAERATPFLSITQDFEIDVAAAQVSLGNLSLSNTSFSVDITPGATIATITGKTPGSTLSISPNDGRLTFNGDQSQLLVGLTASSAGTVAYTITETLADSPNSPHQNVFSIETTAVNTLPVNIAPPTISGTATEGSILAAAHGVYDGAETITGQWYRGSTAIDDATGLAYRLAEADVGLVVSYRETASNSAGPITSSSPATGVVQSGIIARAALTSSTTVDLTVTPRWARMNVDVYPKDVMPMAGIAKGDGTVPYRLGHIAGTSFGGTVTPAWPAYMRGQGNMTGSSGRIQFEVPPGVLVRVKLACGNGASTADQTWSIRDGDTTIVLAELAGISVPAGKVVGADGQFHEAADWLGSDQGVIVKAESGTLVFRRPTGAAAPATYRAIEISYPDFGVNTSSANLPGNAVHVNALTGDDLTGLGTVAKPFKHMPGDPAAEGVVPVFTTTPGAEIRLAGGQSHRPASFTGRRYPEEDKDSGERHFVSGRAGELGAPIKITSYGAGRARLDGSEPLPTGWTSCSAGDVYSNPNYANMQKRAVTWVDARFSAALCDGEEMMYPAQWPSPSNPADWYKSYPGADGYIALTQAQYSAQVTEGANDSGGAGKRLVVVTNDSGTNNLKDRYGPNGVNLVGWKVRFKNGANRLSESTINDHTPSTGRIEFTTPNSAALVNSTPTGHFMFCVCYHPFDVVKDGQYAYAKDLSIAFGHFRTTERAVIRIDHLVYPLTYKHRYIEVDNVDLTRCRDTAFQDVGEGSSNRNAGLALRNSKISQMSSADINGVIRIGSAAKSDVKFTNIEMDDAQRQGVTPFAVEPTTIDKWSQRQGGRTSLMIAVPDLIVNNVDSCDQSSIHGNGAAMYQQAQRCEMNGALIMNHPLPFNLQQSGAPIPDRSNKLRNAILTGARKFPGSAFNATTYLSQIGQGETNSLWEGVVMGMFPIFIGSTLNTTWDNCTGLTFRNCIISGLICNKLNGINFENCLIADDDGRSNVKNMGQLTGFNPASVVRVEVDATWHWDGTISERMQKILTRVGDSETYAARTLGTVDSPWLVPGWGTPFALADFNVKLTTSKVRRNFRPQLAFASLVNLPPGSSISIPAGVDDNSMFDMDRGQVFFTSAPTTGVYNLAVDITNSHPNLAGTTTRRVIIPVTVV